MPFPFTLLRAIIFQPRIKVFAFPTELPAG